jgi:hypothetical protein
MAFCDGARFKKQTKRAFGARPARERILSRAVLTVVSLVPITAIHFNFFLFLSLPPT